MSNRYSVIYPKTSGVTVRLSPLARVVVDGLGARTLGIS